MTNAESIRNARLLACVPRLARRARLRADAVRARHVVLVPDSVLARSESAAEVLALCDGARTAGDILAELSARYPAAPLSREIPALLARLGSRGVLDGVAELNEALVSPPALDAHS